MSAPDLVSDIYRQWATYAELALIDIGIRGSEEMRSYLKPDEGVDTERTLKSLSYATSWPTTGARGLKTGDVKQSDLPSPPTAPKNSRAVNIGTEVPYAEYLNYGSDPMTSGSKGNGAEPSALSFREKILEWAIRKWGDSEDTRNIASFIANKIANEGTTAVPFFEPSIPVIKKHTNTAMADMMERFSDVKGTHWTYGPDGKARKDY
jgi:hypothetical protein